MLLIKCLMVTIAAAAAVATTATTTTTVNWSLNGTNCSDVLMNVVGPCGYNHDDYGDGDNLLKQQEFTRLKLLQTPTETIQGKFLLLQKVFISGCSFKCFS